MLLVWISRNKFAVGLIDFQRINDDLKNANQSCNADKCLSRFEDSLLTYGCQCNENCVQFDTCCLTSRYVEVPRPKLKPTCMTVKNFGQYYFMVDRCPTSNSIWESQCRDELYDDDDILKIVPVTSIMTSVTYKNYFCFRCHEANDEFFFWKVKFERKVYEDDMPGENFMFDYEKGLYFLKNDNGTWIASFHNDSVRLSLLLSLEIPKEVNPLVKPCLPNIITKCANEWTDSEMRELCDAYMGIREVQRDNVFYLYKNLHCALCNFEDLNNMTCKMPSLSGYGAAYDPKLSFSFTHLLDINSSDGDKVGKIQKCDDDHTWDPYVEECRKLTCALPGHKIENGKCVS